MDIKKERRKIYIRCFALLLALWLALMSVFTWHLWQDARYEGRQRFLSLAQDVQKQFTSYLLDQDGPLSENIWLMLTGSWQLTVSQWQRSITASVFTYDGKPVWSPAAPTDWTVLLGKNRYFRDQVAATVDPSLWFDIDALSQELDALRSPHQAKLTFEDVLLTADGEAVPRTMLLEYNYETVATFTNSSFDQYEGELYKYCIIEFPVDALNAAEAVEHREEIEKLQDLTAGSSGLLEMKSDPSDLYERTRATSYTIGDDIIYPRPWDALDCAFECVVGFGPIVKSTWRPNDDALPISYSHPAYWLVITGRSDVWGSAGSYWLGYVLISLLGFLAAAWLLAHAAWKGEKAHLLYQRRTQETANAIAHSLKTPMAVLHASAENLESNICPEKQGAYITEIVRQTEAMDQALLDLLEMASEA